MVQLLRHVYFTLLKKAQEVASKQSPKDKIKKLSFELRLKIKFPHWLAGATQQKPKPMARLNLPATTHSPGKLIATKGMSVIIPTHRWG